MIAMLFFSELVKFLRTCCLSINQHVKRSQLTRLKVLFLLIHNAMNEYFLVGGVICVLKRPVSYSGYGTGTNSQLKLMWGVFSNANGPLFNGIPPNEPPLQASSSPIPSK